MKQWKFFPDVTKYYSEILSYKGMTGPQSRRAYREQWMRGAIDAVQGCQAVFLDPDNGLEAPSVKFAAKAPKYVYYDEVERFLNVADHLVLYHHLGRQGSHLSQIKSRERKLRELAGESHEVFSLLFRPYSPRAYFIITKQRGFGTRVQDFVRSNWNSCFEWVP